MVMWNGNVRVEGKGKERERVENGKEERERKSLSGQIRIRSDEMELTTSPSIFLSIFLLSCF